MDSAVSQRTLVFLLKDQEVLLGYKKTGFGQGYYLGIGGKIEAGESQEQAAIREVYEEVSIITPQLTKVADLTFLFPDKPTWDQRVHVFLSTVWKGVPQESDEIEPTWFAKVNVPLSEMWDVAQFWLPAVLNGHRLRGSISFSPDIKVSTVTLNEIKESA